MSAAAPVRCLYCGGVVFALLFGIGEGVCCGHRFTAIRKSLNDEIKIVAVDQPPKKMAAAAAGSSPARE